MIFKEQVHQLVLCNYSLHSDKLTFGGRNVLHQLQALFCGGWHTQYKLLLGIELLDSVLV